jgi:hypothetical protein
MREVGGAKHFADVRAANNEVQLGTADASNYTGPAADGNGEASENGHTKPLIFPLRDRPEWRRDPRAITFLKTYSPRKLATKQWIGDEEIPYDCVKWWRPFIALANNIDELGAILTRAEGLHRVMAVRGAVRLASMSKEMITKIYRIDKDEEPDLEDAPFHWLMIDLDSKPEPRHFNWLDDPARAAQWAVETYLPSAWKGVRFFYQYSGGAGIKPGLRLHFWFWLSSPITCADLKTDLLRRYGKSFFAPSVFQPSQPNYTAAPIFVNRHNPLEGRRCGFAGGAR